MLRELRIMGVCRGGREADALEYLGASAFSLLPWPLLGSSLR